MARKIRRYTRAESSDSNGNVKGVPLPIVYRQRIEQALHRHTVAGLAVQCETSPTSVIRAGRGDPVTHEIAMRLMLGLASEASRAATDLLDQAEALWERSSLPFEADQDDVLNVATLVADAEACLWSGEHAQLRTRSERLIEQLIGVAI